MSRRWTLGQVFILRHAGFPFDWMEELGLSSPGAAALEAVLAAEDAAAQTAKEEGGPKEETKVRTALESGRPPKARTPALAVALERWAQAKQALETLFVRERERLRERLQVLASNERVQEAVFLSSPAMYENVWQRYVASTERPDSADFRRVERQVYSYLQRLCAKNETTSFFGPMGYGTVEGEGELDVQVVPQSEQRRRTFLSFWAVQELAKAIGREKGIRPHLPLRLNPVFVFEGGFARCPALSSEVPLGPDGARLLEALEGSPTFHELTRKLGVPVGDVERMLLPLMKAAVVVRGLFFPSHTFETFENLRLAVEKLPPVPEREAWLTKLQSLDALRAQFESGNLAARRTLLLKLEALFTELTGQPARRGEGKMYTDRLILYEEASSPFRLRFGRALAERLERALSPGLEMSAAFGERVQSSYAREVRERLGEGTTLDFMSYATRLRPEGIEGSVFAPVPPVTVPDNQVQVGPELLQKPGPGGRFALPDVCLSAKRGADGRLGELGITLSRVHHHLLLWSWLCAFYEDRPRLEQVAQRWLEQEPTARGLVGLAFSRRNKGFYHFPGKKVAYTPSEALELGPEGISASSLRVRITAEGPVLEGPGGERHRLYLPLADFSTYAPFAALAHPLVLHAPLRTNTGSVPRLFTGEAVYQRARWEVELSHLGRQSGLELLVGLARERRRRGWPRFLFARVAGERKPFLVDTASPFSAELLRHALKDDGRVTFEEMLPDPDGLWLQDEHGRYTFELRMQVERWSSDAG